MHSKLNHIKELILGNHYRFSVKAQDEMDAEDLTIADVLSAVVKAPRIAKTLRSTSHQRHGVEKLYVIVGFSLNNLLIYTKGKITQDENGDEIYYFFISSKRDTNG